MTGSAQKPPTLLAFDLGLRRTGVAVGHSPDKPSQPAGVVKVSNGRPDWQQVDRLIARWQPQRLVIGDPRSDDAALLKLVNRFRSHIQQNHKLPIVVCDESYTTDAANAELAERGIKGKDKIAMRDQVAACLILDAYLHSL